MKNNFDSHINKWSFTNNKFNDIIDKYDLVFIIAILFATYLMILQ